MSATAYGFEFEAFDSGRNLSMERGTAVQPWASADIEGISNSGIEMRLEYFNDPNQMVELKSSFLVVFYTLLLPADITRSLVICSLVTSKIQYPCQWLRNTGDHIIQKVKGTEHFIIIQIKTYE
jgi:hypothetical protein